MGTITRGFANLITATGPNAVADGAITAADLASGVIGINTPYFEAKISANQTVTTNTAVKAQFNTENFDTNSNYDNATNYRFTPTTAGKYFCYSHLTVDNGAGNGRSGRIYFYKNGSEYLMSQTNVGSNTYFTYTNLKISAIIDFNGTSDYLEVYGYADQPAGSARFNATAGDGSCYFGAFKIIE